MKSVPYPASRSRSPPLTFLLGGTATLHPEQRQHHPGQQHRRGHHGGDFPAWIPVREPTPTGGAACGTAPGAAPLRKEPAESGSRKLRGCWSLCHAPDPPGGDGRRKRGGGGSSSRAAPAPAPARGGEAAGPEPGEGAGSAGAEAWSKSKGTSAFCRRWGRGGSCGYSNFTWAAGPAKSCCGRGAQGAGGRSSSTR